MNGTYLSLFSGIGGLDLAVEAFGFECVGQVEWDDSCTRVLERWWPTVPRWGDVHEFGAPGLADGRDEPEVREGDAVLEGGRRQRSSVGGREQQQPGTRTAGRGADLVVGGFPCQPASTAGRRKGTADDRWLWPEFARVVGELEPRLVLVENVPGLLTVNGGRAFSEVVGTLADMGYDATWASVRAADAGACHRRQRVFLLASHAESDPRGIIDRESERPAPDADNERHERPGGSRGRWPGSPDGRPFDWGSYAGAVERWGRVLMRPAPAPVDEKGRLAPPFVEWMMGFPEGWVADMKRTQALKALGNAVVPQQAVLALSILAEVTVDE